LDPGLVCSKEAFKLVLEKPSDQRHRRPSIKDQGGACSHLVGKGELRASARFLLPSHKESADIKKREVVKHKPVARGLRKKPEDFSVTREASLLLG